MRRPFDSVLWLGRPSPAARRLAGRIVARALEVLVLAAAITVLLCLFPKTAHAQRVKDLANVKGIRPVHLTGIGLVIGLGGTGDSQRNAVLKQYYVQVLSNLGTGISPAVADVKTRNAALVMVNATVPSSTKPGTEFEVTVSSIGDAESLRDGFLLAVPMKLPHAYEPGEGVIYAEAHGPVYAEGGGSGKLSKARTHAVLTTALEDSPFLSNLESVTLLIDKPDFGTASEIARAINDFDLFRGLDGTGRRGGRRSQIAAAVDSGTVRVMIPTPYLRDDRIVDFISQLLEVEVSDVEREALVAIDRQTGSVVVNGSVLVSLPAFIRYKGAMIRIPAAPDRENEGKGEGQGAAFGGGQGLLVDIIKDLERPEFAFSGADIIHILEQMNRVGAIKGKLVER